MSAGILLIIGSFFWFLPILGLEMFPIGLMLIAIDVHSCAARWPHDCLGREGGDGHDHFVGSGRGARAPYPLERLVGEGSGPAS